MKEALYNLVEELELRYPDNLKRRKAIRVELLQNEESAIREANRILKTKKNKFERSIEPLHGVMPIGIVHTVTVWKRPMEYPSTIIYKESRAL